MKKDEKRAVGIIFIVALILILALEYSNYPTEKRLEHEREKIEERLELSKLKDSIEYKKDYPSHELVKAKTTNSLTCRCI